MPKEAQIRHERRLPRYRIGSEWRCKGSDFCQDRLCIVEPLRSLKSKTCPGFGAEAGPVLETIKKGEQIIQELRSNKRPVGEKELTGLIGKMEGVDKELCALITKEAGRLYSFSGDFRDAALVFAYASRQHTGVLKAMGASPILFGGKWDALYKEHIRRNHAGATDSLVRAFDCGAQAIEKTGAAGGEDIIEECRLFANKILDALADFRVIAKRYGLGANAGIQNENYILLTNYADRKNYVDAFHASF